MTVIIPAAIQADYDAGRVVDFSLIALELASGTYRFWTGPGPLSYDGHTWNEGGGLIRQEAISRTVKGELVAVKLTLRSVPDTDFTPDVLKTIFDEEYDQRPATLSTLYLDPDTLAVRSHIVEFVGRIDDLKYTEQPGGEAEISARLESYLRDTTRVGPARASHNQHLSIYPGDLFFEHSGKIANELEYFGTREPKSAGK
jgi:hypothetical protein